MGFCGKNGIWATYLHKITRSYIVTLRIAICCLAPRASCASCHVVTRPPGHTFHRMCSVLFGCVGKACNAARRRTRRPVPNAAFRHPPVPDSRRCPSRCARRLSPRRAMATPRRIWRRCDAAEIRAGKKRASGLYIWTTTARHSPRTAGSQDCHGLKRQARHGFADIGTGRGNRLRTGQFH